MKNFQHFNPGSLIQATTALSSKPDAWVIAGGIDLLGEMKNGIIEPRTLVNLKALPNLDYIKFSESDGLRIGAMTTLATIESHPEIRERFAVLSEAAHSVATPQIRNVGTLGGNLCQRPRCWYYRNPTFHCLKKGGKECFSVSGENKYNAILGGGPVYIVHPSDCAPALIALDAEVTLAGPRGSRSIPLEKFFILPSENPLRENQLRPGEVVIEIHVPGARGVGSPSPGVHRSLYLKVKERGAWDFALASAAVSMETHAGVCQTVCVVLGGVAPIPWRCPNAEKICIGKRIDDALATEAGRAAVVNAVPLGKNDYKVDMAANLIKRALLMCADSSAPPR
ncbi:MAG: xanthine dehydrogenase family protein subunit M [Terriglobia bacterium]